MQKYGIWVFTGIGIKDFDRFKERHFSTIIEALKDRFSHVVIDCNSGVYFASTLASLKNSDEIKVVTVNTHNCIKDTLAFMSFLKKHWKIDKEKQSMVLNKAGEGGGDFTDMRILFDTIQIIKYDARAIELQESGKIFIPSEMKKGDEVKRAKNRFFDFLRREENVVNKSVQSGGRQR